MDERRMSLGFEADARRSLGRRVGEIAVGHGWSKGPIISIQKFRRVLCRLAEGVEGMIHVSEDHG